MIDTPIDNAHNLLVPFDEDTQNFLRSIDVIINSESEAVRQTVQELAEKGETMDAQDSGLVAIFTAYGILLNRCVLAGWVLDVHPIVDTNNEILT